MPASNRSVAQGPFSFAAGFAAVTAFGGRASVLNVSFLRNSVIVLPDSRKNVFEPDEAYLAATAHGGALFAATLGLGDGRPSLSLSVVDSFFQGNLAPFGGVISAPGSAPIAVGMRGCVFRENAAASDGGVALLGSNVTASFDGCEFAGNEAGGRGGALCVSGNASSTAVTRSNFTANDARLGAVVSASSGHAAALTDCLAASNTAFGGAVAHVAGDSAAGSALVRLRRLRTRNNSATGSALVFLDEPFSPPPACEECSHSGDTAAIGPYPYSTLPASYSASLGELATPRPGGLLTVVMRMRDGYGQAVRSWPNLAFRANAEGTARVGGAVTNNTYRDEATVFTLLQVLGRPREDVSLSVQLFAPTLPELTAQSAAAPATVSTVINDCLPSEVFSNYTERCICIAGYELVLGTSSDVVQAYSLDSLCQKCAPGFYSAEPGSESCRPCLNGLLSTGTSCVPCPEGAVCEATERPLALADYWRAPESNDSFFVCPEDYCLGEVAEENDPRVDQPPPPLAAAAAASDASAAAEEGDDSGAATTTTTTRRRWRRRLVGNATEVLPPPAVFVAENGLLTDEALAYLSQGSVCHEGHTGPLCAVCMPTYSIQQRVCKPCSSQAHLRNWSPALIAGFLILILVIFAILLVFGFLLPLIQPLEQRIHNFFTAYDDEESDTSDSDSGSDGEARSPPLRERLHRLWHPWYERTREAIGAFDAGAVVACARISIDFFQVRFVCREKRETARSATRQATSRLKSSSFHHQEYAILMMTRLFALSARPPPQVVADMADSLDVPWPSTFFQFQSRLALLQLDIFSLPFFSCLNPHTDFYTVYQLYVIGIVCILGSVVILYWVAAAVARRFLVSEHHIYRFRNVCLARALLIMNVSYIAVSRTTVDIYRCKVCCP